MKSKALNISKLSWDSSLLLLAGKSKVSLSLQKLYDSGVKSLSDLIWILPLKIQDAPTLQSFDKLIEGNDFLGSAQLISLNLTPAFGKRGKNKVQLYNATAVVKDELSNAHLNLKWFNTYPSLKSQLEGNQRFLFMGVATSYKGILQITNPKLNPKEALKPGTKIINYPTVNTVPGNYIKKIITKIPDSLWEEEVSEIPSELRDVLNLSSLTKSFKVLHGKSSLSNLEDDKQRIVYEEFFLKQLKVMARRLKNKKINSSVIKISNNELSTFMNLFSYQLTADQVAVIESIRKDFESGHPMMRMLQGDVGCGKTSVALVASLIVINTHAQVALMCPTEALAHQHYETFSSVLPNNIKTSLLLGSTSTRTKKEILNALADGDIDLIIGTHTLFQDSVIYKNLQFAIIDEQHKFGVEQRQRLINKGKGTHSLIMSATPIPRTLQLSQFGDLDISTIRTLPMGRKGIQTRVVTSDTYEKYLSFIKTRISIGEQVYIVVPAIDESETLNIKNISSLIQTYKKYFPDLNIEALHGQLSAQEKKIILERFSKADIDILISTTVIEVGINILNSTVMSIYNPDRFGLSSIHQLRGRVGRGSKAGFCFLIAPKNMSTEVKQRLKVIEKTNDGFEIAKADLHNRGEGQLFGASQSGRISDYKIANIIEDIKVLEKVTQDIMSLEDNKPEKLNNTLLSLSNKTKISSTI